MCGICGIVSLGHEGPLVEKKELLGIRDRMANRGPDGAGMWISPDGRAALGHRRLSIIDLSQQASQPMNDNNGRYSIVFNGEIYNYPELRAKLAAEGQVFRSQSDTEVILTLYQRLGPKMLEFLRGMFAFAIWDDDRKELFLARDHFGIKPLYYSKQGGYFRFASQVKALLAGGALPTSIDQAGRVGFYLLGYVPEPYTLYKDIRALPAGQAKLIDRSGREKDIKYFDLESEMAEAEANIPDAKNARLSEEDLRAALRDSIKYHMVSDVPVGVFLSSGIDSSVIAALSAERNPDLKTLTLGFAEYKGMENDEVPLAEETAARLKDYHTTQWISKGDFAGQLGKILSAMDQPSIDGINTYFVSRATSQTGLKVALSGLGGDELCGSYPSFRQVPQMVNNFRYWKNLRRLGSGLRKLSSSFIGTYTSPKYAGLLEYGWSYGGAYLLRRGLFMPWELPRLMGRDESEQGLAELDILSRLNKTGQLIKTPRLKVMAMELSWYMKNQLLRDSDWAGMAHSLEIRVPWVDVKLFRTLLPAIVKGVLDKGSLLSTVADILPPDIGSRKKTGFSVPVREWLMGDIGDGKQERGLRGWSGLVYRSF